MKTITLRELHARTGYWVREAKNYGEIYVSIRGKIVAKIVPCIAALPEKPEPEGSAR
jgi:antitoxin (DNA-binding transcriptional repressor) of toxin-antitoxin stability system